MPVKIRPWHAQELQILQAHTSPRLAMKALQQAGFGMRPYSTVERKMQAQEAAKVKRALEQLLRAVRDMDADTMAQRPSEEAYLQAVLQAHEVLGLTLPQAKTKATA